MGGGGGGGGFGAWVWATRVKRVVVGFWREVGRGGLGRRDPFNVCMYVCMYVDVDGDLFLKVVEVENGRFGKSKTIREVRRIVMKKGRLLCVREKVEVYVFDRHMDWLCIK